jgi:flagellar hook assembly protein FlgD
VRGPVNLRTLTRGNHAWTWNGRTNSNGAAASGTYRFVVSTTATVNGATVKGLVWRSVVLDNRGPSLTGLNYGGIVYPVRDGYKDTLTLRFRLGEHAATHFTVRDGHGHVVRTITAVRNAGQESFTWNGRNSRNRTVAAGNYTWQLTARDVAGNSSGTARHKVVVSGKRLVNRSVNIVRNGDSFIAAGGSDQSCAEADTSLSAYTHGVWLANACYTGEIAASIYQVSVPAAIQYTRMTVSVGGFASVPPTTIIAGFGRNGATGGDWGFGNLKEIQSSDEGWYTLASRNAAGYVSGRHKVAVSIAVTDDDAPCDFDIAQYEIHLTYKVLA